MGNEVSAIIQKDEDETSWRVSDIFATPDAAQSSPTASNASASSVTQTARRDTADDVNTTGDVDAMTIPSTSSCRENLSAPGHCRPSHWCICDHIEDFMSEHALIRTGEGQWRLTLDVSFTSRRTSDAVEESDSSSSDDDGGVTVDDVDDRTDESSSNDDQVPSKRIRREEVLDDSRGFCSAQHPCEQLSMITTSDFHHDLEYTATEDVRSSTPRENSPEMKEAKENIAMQADKSSAEENSEDRNNEDESIADENSEDSIRDAEKENSSGMESTIDNVAMQTDENSQDGTPSVGKNVYDEMFRVDLLNASDDSIVIAATADTDRNMSTEQGNDLQSYDTPKDSSPELERANESREAQETESNNEATLQFEVNTEMPNAASLNASENSSCTSQATTPSTGDYLYRDTTEEHNKSGADWSMQQHTTGKERDLTAKQTTSALPNSDTNVRNEEAITAQLTIRLSRPAVRSDVPPSRRRMKKRRVFLREAIITRLMNSYSVLSRRHKRRAAAPTSFVTMPGRRYAIVRIINWTRKIARRMR